MRYLRFIWLVADHLRQYMVGRLGSCSCTLPHKLQQQNVDPNSVRRVRPLQKHFKRTPRAQPNFGSIFQR